MHAAHDLARAFRGIVLFEDLQTELQVFLETQRRGHPNFESSSSRLMSTIFWMDTDMTFPPATLAATAAWLAASPHFRYARPRTT